MNSRRKAYMLTNQDSTAIWLLDNLWMPLATSHHTQDEFSLMEQVCGTGIGGPQTHMHPTDEGIFILEGHATFQVGGQEIEAGSRMFVSIPRFTEHSFVIDEPGTRLLNFYTPGGFETLIMTLGMPAPERKAPDPGKTPMPPYWMVMETSREFGQIAAPTMPAADPPTDANRISRPSETNATQPYSSDVLTAPAFWVGNSRIVKIATSEQTGGSYSLLHYCGPKGSGPAPHSLQHDVAIYVLEGELNLTAGQERFAGNAGSFVYIPEGIVHTFLVQSKEARLLTWYLPGGFEKVMEEGGSATTVRNASDRSISRE